MTKKMSWLLLGPSLNAVSGVSTHLKMLIYNNNLIDCEFHHFQVGGEGINESTTQKLIRYIKSPFDLFVRILKLRPEIIHINTSIDRKAFWRDFINFWISKTLSRKIIYQIHGGELPKNFICGNLILKYLFRKTLISADIVIVLSKEELRAYREFESKMNVTHVPNAIDNSKFDQVSKIYNKTEPLRLVYIGRLVKSKGLLEVIEALKIFKNKGGDFIFNIAGIGPDHKEILLNVKNGGLSNEVKFLGAIFSEEKNDLWLSSDIFLFPTWHKEGLPYSILESLASGCVPVTCSIGAIPDVIEDGEQGIFVPSKNPEVLAIILERLDNNRHLLEKMGRKGINLVNNRYNVKSLMGDFNSIKNQLK